MKKSDMTGQEFQDFRVSLFKTPAMMAEFLDVTTMCITHWEKGDRRVPPTTVKLVRLLQKYPQLVKEF